MLLLFFYSFQLSLLNACDISNEQLFPEGVMPFVIICGATLHAIAAARIALYLLVSHPFKFIRKKLCSKCT